MNIGNVKIGASVLAPMAGVTDLAFRIICKEMGAGLVVTEMVSAKGLYYNDKKTRFLTEIKEVERPVALQIFGSDPKIMSAVIREDLNHRDEIDIIDINMGCPAPKIVKNGDGSALLKNPSLVSEILEACVEASNKPLTVKIRSGWDGSNINGLKIAKIAEQAGVDAITVHGRTREMFYRGKADWDIIKEIKSALEIPVIGNGDVYTANDAMELFEHTSCDAVAVGRGSMGNPFIFRNIGRVMDGKKEYNPSNNEILDTILRHLELSCEFKGERIAVREMRKHISFYIKGLRGSNKIKDLVNKLEEKDEVKGLLEEYFSSL